jgi:M6 family metalloprotease-like protein
MYFILCILVIFFSTSNVYSQPSKLQQCRLPNLNPLDDVAIGFPRISNRVRTTGLLNITVLFVDFQDAPATLTPQQVFSIISPEAENFFYVSSYGKLTLRLIPHLRWLRMSRVSTSYNMSQSVTPVDQKAFINEAISLATNVDFSTSDEVVVLTNPAARAIRYGQTFAPKRGNGITVRGRTFENAINSGFDLPNWGSFWLNRELSHTMGLPDLYAFSGNGPLLGFTGGWSLMGNINGVGREYFGWERWLMGWLSNSQVVCVTKKGVSSSIVFIILK